MPSVHYRKVAPVLPLPPAESLPFLGNLIRQCSDCDLRTRCTAPVPGNGSIPAYVMFLGQNPGMQEDAWGKPFIGQAGQQLDYLLMQCGINREDVYITNVCKCLTRNNAPPKPASVKACAKWLDIELGLVQPKIIVAMGAFAIRRMLGDDADTVEHLHGRPIGKDGRIILPCYHPAAGLHDTSTLRFLYDDFQVLRGLLQGKTVADYTIRDAYPNPLYQVADTERKLKQMTSEIMESSEFAVDTELWKQNTELWSAQFSTQPDSGWFVPVKSGFKGRLDLTQYPATAIVHNYLFDVNWLDIADDRFQDNMILAYLLGLPQGLKELASRLCGIRMINYSEVVRPGQRKLSLHYLSEVNKREWPDPPPIEETKWDNKQGKIVTKFRKPWHISRKVDKILADLEVNSDVDPYDRWRQIPMEERADVEKKLGVMPESSLADIRFSEAVEYATRDASSTLRVYRKLRGLITEAGLDFILYLDQSVLPEVHEMMMTGMAVDIPYLKELSQYYSDGMAEAAEQASAKMGHPFNPSSRKQVAEVVYSELGRKPSKTTATGLICTDDRELKKVNHPVIADILTYRRLNKNKGTFADSLVRNAVCHQENGQSVYRVHTTLKVTRTDTGRLSSSEPINLQTMPTRTDEGKKIRKGFKFSPGFTGIAGDFIQQEMKVQAHLAQCKTMLDMFRQGVDFHTATAAKIFGVPMEVAEQKKYRYPAKTMNFAVIYMISPKGLAETIHENAVDIIENGKPLDVSNWTDESCGKLIAEWYKMYPEVRDYQMEQIAFARRYGYIVDMFGRRRYTPEVSCPIREIRESGERAVVNMPVQSSSQGITKLAMSALWQDWIKLGRPVELRWLMQIHDEVMLEVKSGESSVLRWAIWLKNIMDNVVTLSVPMISDVKAGENWAEMKKIEI